MTEERKNAFEYVRLLITTLFEQMPEEMKEARSEREETALLTFVIWWMICGRAPVELENDLKDFENFIRRFHRRAKNKGKRRGRPSNPEEVERALRMRDIEHLDWASINKILIPDMEKLVGKQKVKRPQKLKEQVRKLRSYKKSKGTPSKRVEK